MKTREPSQFIKRETPQYDRSKSFIKLDTPLQYIKGVGPKLSEKLKKRLLHTVEDFINWFPRSYQDNRAVKNIKSITPDQPVVFIGYILKKNIIPIRSGRGKIYEIIIGDGEDFISCKFFRAPYKGWFQSLNQEDSVQVRGTASFYKNKFEFHHPQIFPVSSDEESSKEDLLIPLYTENESITQTKLRKIMLTVLEKLESTKEEWEWLPPWLRKKYDLVDRFTALKGVHFPEKSNKNNIDDYLNFKTKSQKRLIFDELFELQVYLALKKKGWQSGVSYKIPSPDYFLKSLEQHLPFSLTLSQQNALSQILKDIDSVQPMHRLIQGDVGCGKTIVALIASLACAKNKFQTALMVPTEILAEQHYQSACQFFKHFEIKVEKLTGQMKVKEKRQVLEKLKSGECDLCIGTHALIQEGIDFHRLGLVIIDEQHRFGAHQRSLLKSKGNHPHFLVMTATPIPRTLSLACYGDLDISTITELPKGRQAILTRRTFSHNRPKVFEFLKEQIKKGLQAYVVYPLIQESEHLDLKNAIDQYEKLKNEYANFKWGLLTGKMSSEDKQNTMDQFKNNKIQALVSTTVIEVGVDVPNANLMVIEHAERFGLAQMHQLRGRVGRGSHKSYCVIVLGENSSQIARSRAHIMEKISDGFQISEKDLELRGPGEFMGVRQSGLPHFKIAQLIRDQEILSLAQKAAQELIQRDPNLKDSNHLFIKNKFKQVSDSIRPG